MLGIPDAEVNCRTLLDTGYLHVVPAYDPHRLSPRASIT